MLTILKNDFERLREDKLHLCISIGLTLAAMIIAILISNVFETKMKLAVVGNITPEFYNDMIQITKVNEAPEKSELILNHYDAVVTIEKNGDYRVTSIKGQDFERKLTAILHGKKLTSKDLTQERKVGTNIIGFMLMFILMQGMFYLRTFSDDKERHMVERISVSPIGFANYMTGHFVFSWNFIFFPSIIVVSICKIININIGFSLWQYAVLLAVMALAATAFAVLMTSLFAITDNANMIGNSIIILSSLLSGSFFAAGNKGSIMEKISYIFPQKGFMEFVQTWENGGINFKDSICLIYVIILAIVLTIIGICKTRMDYRFRRS